MSFEIIWESLPALLGGVPLTLKLALLSVAIGFVLALVVLAARQSRFAWLVSLAKAYVFVFRGTPLLVQIFFIYYGLSQFDAVRASALWPVLRDPFWCATLALALNTAAYASEIMRGGLLAVPRGVIEAAKALGLRRVQILWTVTMPIAARQAIPAYGNELILMVKATSLASTVTLLEVTGIAKQIISRSYAVFEIFILAGAIYLLLNLATTMLVAAAERRLNPQARIG